MTNLYCMKKKQAQVSYYKGNVVFLQLNNYL